MTFAARITAEIDLKWQLVARSHIPSWYESRVLDLLTLITDLMARALPYVGKARTESQRRQIGVHLFLVYLRLHDCVIGAADVVRVLRAYVDLFDQYRYPPNVIGVVGVVREQATNLSRFWSELAEVDWATAMLDPGLTMPLWLYSREKADTLRLLLRYLEDGRLPLFALPDDLYAEAARRTLGVGDAIVDDFILSRRLFDSLKSAPELDMASTDARSLEAVHAYLEDPRTSDRIAQLTALSNQFHAALTANFSVPELLPHVERSLRRHAGR